MLWLWCVTLGCELIVRYGPAPKPPKKYRHKVEKRVREGEAQVDPHAPACHTYIRRDAPANPYES
jgi:hypothetical protein